MTVTDTTPAWPSLMEQRFDPDADYAGQGALLENMQLLRRHNDRLAQSGVEVIYRAHADYEITPMKALGNARPLRSFCAGQMEYRHGVFKAQDVRMINPNGAVFLQNETEIVTESTWQSRMHLHPHYKSNRSTKWRFQRIGEGPWTDSIGHMTEPVLLAYSRSYHQYFHWLIDALPKIWIARKAGLTDLPVLVGPIAPDGFQMQTLAALGLSYDQVITPAERVVQIDTAYLAYSELVETLKVRPSLNNGVHYKGGWDPEYLRWVNDLITSAARDVPIDRPKRIYVDRSAAHHRRLMGAGPFEAFLRENEFTFLDPGQYSLLEQCALFSEAEVVVGAHGAGMTNILWCNPDRPVRVLEIFPDGLEDTGYTFMSSAFGFDHTVLYCAASNPEKDAAWTDIELDPDLAIGRVRAML